MPEGLPDFGKQVGPLPLGAWVAVVGGGLAVAVYSQRNSKSATTTYVDDNSVESGVGQGGVGALSQTTGLSSVASVPEAEIVDNEQWGRAAIKALIADGYDPNMSDSAIRKYLATNVTSAQEYTLVGIALRKIGPPPVPLPPAPDQPTPSVATPVAAPRPPVSVPSPYIPPPPPPPPAIVQQTQRTYTVVPGDSLSKIASRYPETYITWQSLYNLNRGVIGGNPNLIRPGQVLIIG